MDTSRRQLIDNIRIAIAAENSNNDILRTAVELIDGYSDNYNWTGFYLMKGNVLEVGPYIGPPTEHVKIDLDKGICGAAASQKKTLVVDNVKADPRFIACSLGTRSEIVVPMLDGDTVLGEIDVDSDRPANFNQHDVEMLEAIAGVVVERLKQIG